MDSKTVASITFQNLFNRYEKKCGMTGTAITEEKEFKEIYNLNVVVIPTNRPNIRIDNDDLIYKTHKIKVNKIVEEVLASYEIGQPILVGTSTIEQSEEISTLLKEKNIPHNVLNAKYHEQEAEIVSHAGEYKAVTIATNMAGRGTDIKLNEETKNLGLKIIGTNRHESRRIDNQLRGRSGRQGDKGETVFILSLEDELIRLFGGSAMSLLVEKLNLPDDLPLTHPMISKNVEKAQKMVESNNYEVRKRLYDYDLILNEQCEVIYKQRAEVLDKGEIHNNIIEIIKDVIDMYIDSNDKNGVIDKDNLICQLNKSFSINEDFNIDTLNNGSEIFKYSCDYILNKYNKRKEDFDNSEEEFKKFENVIFLKVIDKLWEKHINTMTELRKSIGLQSYANKDPLVEYKIIGGDLFNEMLQQIKLNICFALFNSVVQKVVVKQTNEEDNNKQSENI
jgi:preprotein translocase subunit SecA